VRLEASIKPHVYQKIEIFWTNIASTMTCPNLKNGPKNGLCPLGLKEHLTSIIGLEGNKIYNCQFFQLRNNGFRVFGGVGDHQSLQNVIVIILYNVQFLHGMSTFNKSSVEY
jgi:hypothetical protein